MRPRSSSSPSHLLFPTDVSVDATAKEGSNSGGVNGDGSHRRPSVPSLNTPRRGVHSGPLGEVALPKSGHVIALAPSHSPLTPLRRTASADAAGSAPRHAEGGGVGRTSIAPSSTESTVISSAMAGPPVLRGNSGSVGTTVAGAGVFTPELLRRDGGGDVDGSGGAFAAGVRLGVRHRGSSGSSGDGHAADSSLFVSTLSPIPPPPGVAMSGTPNLKAVPVLPLPAEDPEPHTGA